MYAMFLFISVSAVRNRLVHPGSPPADNGERQTTPKHVYYVTAHGMRVAARYCKYTARLLA